jgi:cytoskeletal protein RodZ
MTTEENENNTPEDNQEIPHAGPEVISTPAAPEMTLGQLIKSKREEKNLSLKVISHQTKIHIGLLESLEADQLEKLPSKAYVRGFIKSTTKILGIDYNMALGLLDKAYEKNAPKIHHAIPNQEMKTETARNTLSAIAATPLETVRSVTLSSGMIIVKGIAVIAIIGIIGFNIKNYMQKTADEGEVKLPEVLTTLHRKKPAAPKPKVEPVPVEAKVEEPIEINLIQDKNQKVDVTVKDINLQTISLGEKQFVEDTSMPETTKKEILPDKYRIPPVKGTETIFINATEGDSWLTYKVDDKDIKKYVLRQGRTLFLRGSIIRLFLGNTYSLKVFYNNKLLNLTANNKTGVKNLVFPEELKTKYMAPLFVFQDDGTVVTSDDFLKANQGKTPPTPLTLPTTTPVKPKTP